MGGSTAQCKAQTDAHRNCLKECRDAGRSKTASKTCKPLAVKLDSCREAWRKKHQPAAAASENQQRSDGGSGGNNEAVEMFDGTRILPHPKCRPLSCDVQKCIKWRGGDQKKCATEIEKLRKCMESTKGTIAEPTEGDKVWSDYNK